MGSYWVETPRPGAEAGRSAERAANARVSARECRSYGRASDAPERLRPIAIRSGRPTREEAPMRLVGYIRVSTRKQAEEGHGLDAQRSLLTAWAGQHEHELVSVIPDVMTSRRTDKLHGREAAIRLVDTGLADGLLILRWDRATRSLIDGQTLLQRSRDGGWPILDTYGKSSLSKSDNLMTNMEQVIAEDERERISQRTKEGLAAARLKGKVPGRPAADLPGMTLHMLADLQDSGESARSIAQTLNERGVPSPGAGGARWSHSTVLRVMRRLADEAEAVAS